MNIIKIKDLNFKYNNNCIFNNFDLNIKSNIITTIIGKSCSGKSTLAKIISGQLKYQGTVSYNDFIIDSNIKKIISYIPDNPKIKLINDTVIKNLIFAYNESINEKDDYNLYLNNAMEIIDIKNLFDMNINTLSTSQLVLVSIACELIKNPQILILDEILSYLTISIKEDLIKKFKKSKLTIINITSNIEETLYSNEIIIISDFKVLAHDKYKKILENDKLLKKNNISTPFVVNVSKKLTYYNLINKIYYKISKLVNNIWE